MVPHDNPTTEIVTYTVQDGYNRKFYVDDYAPDAYHELDSNVCFPVYIKAYNRKNGEPSYTLNIQKRDIGRGERFRDLVRPCADGHIITHDAVISVFQYHFYF